MPLRARRPLARKLDVFLLGGIFITLIAWKTVDAWVQVEQTRASAAAQQTLMHETTRQMELMRETIALSTAVPVNVPPAPTIKAK